MPLDLRGIKPVLVVAGTLSLLLFAVWFAWPKSPRSANQLALNGHNVDQLKEGDLVVWGKDPIGKVAKITNDGPSVTAWLEIDEKIHAQIPHTAEFEIGSLHWVMPGNVGVKVISSTVAHDGKPLTAARARTSIVPAQTPLGFWLVLGTGAIMVLVGLAVSFRLVTAKLLWKAMIAFVLTLAIHLFCRSIGGIDQVQDWVGDLQGQVQRILEHSSQKR